jgi:RNA polymerase sigma-70 factor (ECF subfamily)
MENLSDKIRKGDEQAFRVFYEAEFGNVVYFVRQYVNNADVAADIAQESLLSVWINRENIDPDRNLRAYLYVTARNKTLNLLKSNSFKIHNIYSGELDANIKALSDESLDDMLEALTLRDLISKTYAGLPEDVKDCFMMNREYGLTYQEIADRKGVSVKSVEYKIKIALKTFKSKLKDYLTMFLFL